MKFWNLQPLRTNIVYFAAPKGVYKYFVRKRSKLKIYRSFMSGKSVKKVILKNICPFTTKIVQRHF